MIGLGENVWVHLKNRAFETIDTATGQKEIMAVENGRFRGVVTQLMQGSPVRYMVKIPALGEFGKSVLVSGEEVTP